MIKLKAKYRNLNRNIGYVVKRASNQQAIASIAASRMYKELGIITPPVFILKHQVKNLTDTIQQDVTYFDNFSTVLAADEVAFEKLDKKVFGKYKWQMFFDTELEMEFLKFMTPDCLEQLKNVFLVDEIRTDSDRHNRNYFFYRGKNSDKHEGVIAIDLEQMLIDAASKTYKNPLFIILQSLSIFKKLSHTLAIFSKQFTNKNFNYIIIQKMI